MRQMSWYRRNFYFVGGVVAVVAAIYLAVRWGSLV